MESVWRQYICKFIPNFGTTMNSTQILNIYLTLLILGGRESMDVRQPVQSEIGSPPCLPMHASIDDEACTARHGGDFALI